MTAHSDLARFRRVGELSMAAFLILQNPSVFSRIFSKSRTFMNRGDHSHGNLSRLLVSRARDPNEFAHRIFFESIGEATKAKVLKEKNPAAVALGRLGGLKAGHARAAALMPAKLSQMAAKARWGK